MQPAAEHAADLALAQAAARGDTAAVREVEALITAEGTAAARRIDRAPAFADEVCQALRVRLLVADDGRVRIADYLGRGPLRGWLGVAALRAALNLRRGQRPGVPELLTELVATDADPELAHLRTLYRAEFRDALEHALRSLSERQRAILRLTYVDGMRLVHLARLYGVHETTAGRWVEQAAGEVATAARRELMARLALSASTLDSVTRLVRSHLDLSLARILDS